MNITTQTVEGLKISGYYFAAGALAAQMKLGKSYGCHYGMRSELENARRDWLRGYDAASQRV